MSKYPVHFIVLTIVLVAGLSGSAYGYRPLDDPALIGWWTCDEGEGTVVADSSVNGNDGTFVNGDPVWVEGVYGTAVELTIPTLIEIPAMDLTLEEATMAGWIKPYGAQPDWASLMMHREAAPMASTFSRTMPGLSLERRLGNLELSWGRVCCRQ